MQNKADWYSFKTIISYSSVTWASIPSPGWHFVGKKNPSWKPPNAQGGWEGGQVWIDQVIMPKLYFENQILVVWKEGSLQAWEKEL